MQAETVVLETPAESPQFFAQSAMIMAAIVLLSFPLTYYLPVATASRQFHLLHHVHGITCFAWFGLYVWQTRLVASGRIARHREIGLMGFALTAAIIPLGFWMAQRAAEVRMADGAARPYEFTWFNVVDISLFAALMLASIALVTRHKEWHKRLTYAAAVSLVAPAATRWTLRVPYLDPFVLDLVAYLVVVPLLVALVLHDRRTFGKLHPAPLASIAVRLPLQLSSPWVARTDWWNTVAPGLIGSP